MSRGARFTFSYTHTHMRSLLFVPFLLVPFAGESLAMRLFFPPLAYIIYPQSFVRASAVVSRRLFPWLLFFSLVSLFLFFSPGRLQISLTTADVPMRAFHFDGAMMMGLAVLCVIDFALMLICDSVRLIIF